jgi:hypothetical protein
MLVTINGEQQEMPVTFKRAKTPLEQDALYVGDLRATLVTHSLRDDIPVIVQVDELVIEIDPQQFYSIQGMDHDWEPGDQSHSIGGSAGPLA